MDAKLSVSNEESKFNLDKSLLPCNKDSESTIYAHSLFFAYTDSSVQTMAADAPENQKIGLTDLAAIIQGDVPQSKVLAARYAKQYYETGDKKMNELSNQYKRQLPYFLCSGFCPRHHNDSTLEYNGCVQIDLDFKRSGGDLLAKQVKNVVVQKLKNGELPSIVFVALSPRDFGVKILVSTNNTDTNCHKDVCLQVIQEFYILLAAYGVLETDFDALALSQPCFVPYDKDAFWNTDFVPYDYTFVPVPPKKQTVSKIATPRYLPDHDLDVDFKLNACYEIASHRFKNNCLGRNDLVFKMSCIAKEYNIFENDLLFYAIQQFAESDFNEKEITTTVRSAYRRAVKNYYSDAQLVVYLKKLGFSTPEVPQKSLECDLINPTYSKAPDGNFLHGKKGEYLTDILERHQVALTPTNICGQTWIVPTGTGKTYMIFKFSKKNPTIIICPTIALVQMCCKKYGATPFYGTNPDIQKAMESPFIAVTYASFAKLSSEMTEQEQNYTGRLQKDLHQVETQIKNLKALSTVDVEGLEKRYQHLEVSIQLKKATLNHSKSIDYEGKFVDKFQSNIRKAQNEISVLEVEAEKIKILLAEVKPYDQTATDQELQLLDQESQRLKTEIETIQKHGILKKYHLFIDESHNFTANTQKGFQLKDLNHILTWSTFYASFTCVTGTHLKNCHSLFANMPLKRVLVPEEPVLLHSLNCDNVIASAIELIKQSVSKKRIPIVLLNDKGDKLTALKAGLNDVQGIHFFNSDNKEDIEFQQVIKESLLSSVVKGIITTSVIKEGIDILNDACFDILFIGDHHSSTIKQFIARIRKGTVTAYQLKSQQHQTNDKTFDYQRERRMIETLSKRRCDELNLCASECDTSSFAKSQLDLKNVFHKLPVSFDEQANHYEINYLEMSNMLHHLETIAENENKAFQREQLAQYNIVCLDNEDSTVEKRDEARANIKEAIEAVRAQEKEEFLTILERLDGKLDAKTIIEKKSKDNHQTKIAKRTYKYLDRILKIGYSDVNTVIANAQYFIESPSEKNFKLLETRMKYINLKNNILFMDTNNLLSIQLKAFSRIDTTLNYTSDELRKKALQIVSLDKSVDLAPYQDKRIDKCLEVLESFFEIDMTQCRKNGKRVYVYHLSPVTLKQPIPKEAPAGINREILDDEMLILDDEIEIYRLNSNSYVPF